MKNTEVHSMSSFVNRLYLLSLNTPLTVNTSNVGCRDRINIKNTELY